eukprot:TRINITY_DN29959_c0_g1_i1.p1 TRINITY_DN29959_c0_g1~~TRINITY_DN29959_c0_g1_i1.p1  ORF type:complete len:1377 (-),score=295.51 TRINITY_DN29959_c0_g1_i1:54-4184(-)
MTAAQGPDHAAGVERGAPDAAAAGGYPVSPPGGASAEGSGEVFKVSLTKQNTIAKLIDRLWDNKISAEELGRRLPDDFWAEIRDAASREEMQRVAKTATNRVRRGFRLEKQESKRQQRRSQDTVALQRYSLLALPVRELTEQERVAVSWLQLPAAVLPELHSPPPRRYFAARQWDSLVRELVRLRQKRAQMEYIAGQVLSRLEVSAATARPIARIVDVGGGRGDFALLLAWLLSQRGRDDVSITVVESEAILCRQGQRRARALEAELRSNGLACPRLQFRCCAMEAYDQPFDLAVSVEANGPLADVALERCCCHAAEFVLLTGRFSQIPARAQELGLIYPRAGGTLVRGKDSFFELCHIADSSTVDKEASQAARIVNSDRCCRVRQLGGWASLSAIPRQSLASSSGAANTSAPALAIIAGTASALLAGVADVDVGAGVDASCSATARAADAKSLVGVPLPVGGPAKSAPAASDVLRVVMVADTHCRHRELTMPPGDLLLVCGDFTKSGTAEEVEDFALWLDGLPYAEKVVVAGNHEITFDAEYYKSRGRQFHRRPGEEVADPSSVRNVIANRAGIRYLENAGVTLSIPLSRGDQPGADGAAAPRTVRVRLYGSPGQGPFFDGHSMAAFTLTRERERAIAEATDAWAAFCGDAGEGHGDSPVDILVTHGPPHGIGDLSTEHGGSAVAGDADHDGAAAARAKRAGSRALLAASKRARPLLHAFGHMHEGYGVLTDGETIYANSAICSERYVAQRLPIVVDLPVHLLGCDRPRGAARDVTSRCWLARPGSLSTYGDAGRPRHGGAVSGLYRRLMETLHNMPEIHSSTAGTSGYRNKASFSLGALYSPQDSCAPELNELAAWLQAEASQAPELWVEAALKLSRRGTLGLKAVLRGEEAARAWVERESQTWWSRLRTAIPTVVSVTFQIAPANSDEKPPKSPWHPRYPMPTPLFGDPFIVEETPRKAPGLAGLPFRLSPDAFSEVNHRAEDAMFQTLVDWITEFREELGVRVLGMFGRNSGFLGLAMQDAFNFERCYAYTHCPVTLADIEASVGMNPGMEQRWVTGRAEKYDFGATLASIPEGQGPMLVHVTNSRHGLAEGIVPALKARRDVVAVAYNSCSHLPLPGEWQELCSGPGAFELRRFRSFDLLAGTEFESSYFLLVRRPPVLVLPVGPPGVGKSWLARQLAVTCSVFERDRAFFEERMREDVGFAVAKRRTHSRLLDALQRGSRERSSLLLDSTNGLKESRATYCRVFQPERLIFLALRPPSEDFILSRLRGREGSADTPEHERLVGLGGLRPDASDEDVLAKVARVLESVEYPDSSERPCGRASNCSEPVLLEADASNEEAVERALWRAFVLLVCPFLADLNFGESAQPAKTS